ncbi:hypothetical protein BV25DRAFT_166444 [Artomyces pyxidatus]|uniref:Uncharacterized protein n=1 Tax=Artomyces pyxidatus TaxID=48021 RepID=A0ACB8SI60_9AGAM|nr:hypothetical protein BV25DRAFT_166444 [Artomyces pyxidatus]
MCFIKNIKGSSWGPNRAENMAGSQQVVTAICIYDGSGWRREARRAAPSPRREELPGAARGASRRRRLTSFLQIAVRAARETGAPTDGRWSPLGSTTTTRRRSRMVMGRTMFTGRLNRSRSDGGMRRASCSRAKTGKKPKIVVNSQESVTSGAKYQARPTQKRIARFEAPPTERSVNAWEHSSGSQRRSRVRTAGSGGPDIIDDTQQRAWAAHDHYSWAR